jgi:hypothetical protein
MRDRLVKTCSKRAVARSSRLGVGADEPFPYKHTHTHTHTLKIIKLCESDGTNLHNLANITIYDWYGDGSREHNISAFHLTYSLISKKPTNPGDQWPEDY